MSNVTARAAVQWERLGGYNPKDCTKKQCVTWLIVLAVSIGFIALIFVLVLHDSKGTPDHMGEPGQCLYTPWYTEGAEDCCDKNACSLVTVYDFHDQPQQCLSCLDFGTCRYNVSGSRYCECETGRTGKFCEIVNIS